MPVFGKKRCEIKSQIIQRVSTKTQDGLAQLGDRIRHRKNCLFARTWAFVQNPVDCGQAKVSVLVKLLLVSIFGLRE